MDLLRRRDATQKTLDQYRGAPFDWSLGPTCVHLARSHLVNLGYDLPKIPEFSTPQGALRALKSNGWDSVGDMLDEFLTPIPAAMLRLGDVVTIPGDAGMDAMFIFAGPNKMFGWGDEQVELAVGDILGLDRLKGAWQV